MSFVFFDSSPPGERFRRNFSLLDNLRKFKICERGDRVEKSVGVAEFLLGVEKICVAFAEFFLVKAEENFSLN